MGNTVENYIDKIISNGLEKDYWFMTKQTMTDFYFILTIARVVDSYKTSKKPNENFGLYYQRYFQENEFLKIKYPKQADSENTYRNSIIAEFFGLFKREKSSYDSAIVTPAFQILEKYIKNYEDVEKFRYIIERQIEKLCLNVNDKIQNYTDLSHVKIFPVMFLYKVLLELYKRTSKSTLYYDEFVLFLFRMQKYGDWQESIDLILEYREHSISQEYKQKVSKILNDVTASNIRFDTLLGTLSNINYEKKQDRNFFEIKNTTQAYRYIENAIELFEHSKYSQDLSLQELQNFLQSDRYFIGYLDVAFVQNEIEEDNDLGKEDIFYKNRLTGAENIILYGVPGAGKSYTIKHEYCDDEECMERLVFHPDYTYSDFVGQIMPKISSEKNVTYEFTAGPFTKIVKKAYENPDKMFYLVIEEINRGNAPAIFGDIFQLLDRQGKKIKDKSSGELVDNPNYGASEYAITNADIAKEVYGNGNHKVSLPSNLSILCTMNTSDQNVFTLDTAFQRRWSMRLIRNQFPEDGSEKEFANTSILDTDVTWEKFFTVINDLILTKNIRMTSAEDKRLGTHFVSQEDLKYDDYEGDDKDIAIAAMRQNRRFAEKVLKYMWDDAFKFNKDDVFDINKVNSLEKVILLFTTKKGNERFAAILKDTVYKSLIPEQQ